MITTTIMMLNDWYRKSLNSSRKHNKYKKYQLILILLNKNKNFLKGAGWRGRAEGGGEMVKRIEIDMKLFVRQTVYSN